MAMLRARDPPMSVTTWRAAKYRFHGAVTSRIIHARAARPAPMDSKSVIGTPARRASHVNSSVAAAPAKTMASQTNVLRCCESLMRPLSAVTPGTGPVRVPRPARPRPQPRRVSTAATPPSRIASRHVVFAGVSPRCRLPRRAECNKAPFMYEMKGALSGRAAPDRPVARPSLRRTPPRQCQAPRKKYRFPCLSCAPGVAPGWCPLPTVNVFLLPLAEPRKSPREFIFTLFGVHTLFTEFGRLSARHGRYPPLYTQPVHRLPGVT